MFVYKKEKKSYFYMLNNSGISSGISVGLVYYQLPTLIPHYNGPIVILLNTGVEIDIDRHEK